MRSVKARGWVGAFVITVVVVLGAALSFSATGSAESARPKQTTKNTFEPKPPSCVPTQTPDGETPCPSLGAPGSSFEGVQVAVNNVVTYINGVQRHQEEVAQAAAEQAARDAAASQQATSEGQATPVASASGTGGCASGGGGNWAVPEYIVNRESGGDYCARNPSGACGAYQIMQGTWNGYGGYSSACDAPPAVQDEKASQMAPCNWVAPNYCAG